jgi:hypothetical protein
VGGDKPRARGLKRRYPTPPGYGARRAEAEARRAASEQTRPQDDDDDDDDDQGAAGCGCLTFLLALLAALMALAVWADG